MANLPARLCRCARCLSTHPDGKWVCERTYYRHIRSQRDCNRTGKSSAAFRCLDCPEYPNGHYLSRPAFYKHRKNKLERQSRPGATIQASNQHLDETLPRNEFDYSVEDRGDASCSADAVESDEGEEDDEDVDDLQSSLKYLFDDAVTEADIQDPVEEFGQDG
jgi:hypothetical protein